MSSKNVLSCNCLNVIIQLETNELSDVSKESLNLSEEELQNDFFKQKLEQINKLKRIDKQHAFLVQSNHVGDWIVHFCINCGCYTHAIHKELGANFVLITKELQNNPSIEEQQNNECYSKVYKILIRHELKDTPISYNMEVNFTPEIELLLNNLKQLASDSINAEAAVVEERIRKFAEKENAALEVFREKTRAEQIILSKLLISSKVKSKNVSSTAPVFIVQEQKQKKEKIRDVSEVSPSNRTNSNAVATKKLKSSPIQIKANEFNNIPFDVNDSEGLFELDGIEDKQQIDPEYCDSSDNEDLILEERRRPTSINLAKSLPIDIPAFMTITNDPASEEDSLFAPDDGNPSDIAASIKALAKSVHGDDVFGDLPRPRICNQF